jgi:hypothetical protein
MLKFFFIGLEVFLDYIIDIDKQRFPENKKSKKGEPINFF